MQWMVEIGRIDIAIEVSQLSYQLAYPQEGHLEATLRDRLFSLSPAW